MDKKKKKKDHKSGSTIYKESEERYLLLNKEDQNHSGAKKNTSGSSSHENAPLSNLQFQTNFQWPYSTQSVVEQTPLTSKPSTPSQEPSPFVPGQWPQNSHLHQVQLSQAAPHSTAMSFWLAQQPGYHLPGDNGVASYHTLTPAGTTNISWQGAGTTNGDFATGNQLQPPCFSYPVGYPYPSFPGPWGPASWWGEPQHSLPPFNYPNTGARGYFSSPPFPYSLTASASSSQRGVMQPPVKLSQKHQQLWEAQSAENVQLWSAVGHLQSELVDYKNRLTKLEADASLKPTMKEPEGDIGSSLPGEKKTKRGRPRKKIALNDVNPATDQSFPPVCCQKPRLHNARNVIKDPNTEKYSQKKLENKVIYIQKETDGKPENAILESCGKIEISNSIFHKPSQDMETNNYATYGGTINEGKIVWPSNTSTGLCGKELLKMGSRSFSDDVSVSNQARTHPGGWSFGNEDVSVHHATESGIHENEQIDHNDGGSSAEETI